MLHRLIDADALDRCRMKATGEHNHRHRQQQQQHRCFYERRWCGAQVLSTAAPIRCHRCHHWHRLTVSKSMASFNAESADVVVVTYELCSFEEF